MAFCKEPSDEHLLYLRELVDAGEIWILSMIKAIQRWTTRCLVVIRRLKSLSLKGSSHDSRGMSRATSSRGKLRHDCGNAIVRYFRETHHLFYLVVAMRMDSRICDVCMQQPSLQISRKDVYLTDSSLCGTQTLYVVVNFHDRTMV